MCQVLIVNGILHHQLCVRPYLPLKLNTSIIYLFFLQYLKTIGDL